MAYATIAIMNWNVTGSIGRRLPQVVAPFQACISIAKHATIRRHEFPERLHEPVAAMAKDDNQDVTGKDCRHGAQAGTRAAASRRFAIDLEAAARVPA